MHVLHVFVAFVLSLCLFWLFSCVCVLGLIVALLRDCSVLCVLLCVFGLFVLVLFFFVCLFLCVCVAVCVYVCVLCVFVAFCCCCVIGLFVVL